MMHEKQHWSVWMEIGGRRDAIGEIDTEITWESISPIIQIVFNRLNCAERYTLRRIDLVEKLGEDFWNSEESEGSGHDWEIARRSWKESHLSHIIIVPEISHNKNGWYKSAGNSVSICWSSSNFGKPTMALVKTSKTYNDQNTRFLISVVNGPSFIFFCERCKPCFKAHPTARVL